MASQDLLLDESGADSAPHCSGSLAVLRHSQGQDNTRSLWRYTAKDGKAFAAQTPAILSQVLHAVFQDAYKSAYTDVAEVKQDVKKLQFSRSQQKKENCMRRTVRAWDDADSN